MIARLRRIFWKRRGLTLDELIDYNMRAGYLALEWR